MRIITENTFIHNYSSTLDEAVDLPLIISRENKTSVVIMSLNSYRAIELVFELMKEDPQKLYHLYREAKKHTHE